jgi:hypothetical protein
MAVLGGLVFAAISSPANIFAGAMVKDPKGYHGIAWGSALDEVAELTRVVAADRITEYELKAGPPPLGGAQVDAVRFIAIDGLFARVTIRYKGKEAHAKIVAYLESEFGPIDQTPGQTMAGLTQQFNWRGADTEVNLTYQHPGERGFVFIESYALSRKFIELYGDTTN